MKNKNKKEKDKVTRNFRIVGWFLLLLVLVITMSMAITVTQITPTSDNVVTSNSSIQIQYNISAPLNTEQWLQDFSVTNFVNLSDNNDYSKNTTGNSTTPGAISIGMWIRPDTFNFGGISQGYVNYASKTSYSPANYEWLFRMYNDTAVDGVSRSRRFSFYVFNATNGVGIGSYYQNATYTTAGRWLHVMGVINGTTTKIYVDGVLRDTDTYASTLSPVNTIAPVEIGADTDNGGANNYFRGGIDEFRIYNYSLNSSDIMSIYSAGRTIAGTNAVSKTGLVLWLPMNESTGNPIDASGKAHTGITNTGAVWDKNGDGPMTALKFSWDNTNYTLYDSSLVLFYNFDNRSALGENDTHVKDLSMYGNNGTVIGGSNISWTPNGKYGGAFNFSGVGSGPYNGGIKISNLNFNLSATDGTICLWVNIFGNGKGGVQNLVGKYAGSAPEWDIRYDNSTNIFKFVTRNSTLTTGASRSGVVFNTWYHICGVSNRVSSLVTIYINGLYVDDETLATGLLDNTLDLGIGSSAGTGVNTRPTNGTIDNVMIFNRSLSTNEIQQLYYSTLTKYDSQNWSFITNQTINNTLNSTQTSYNFPYYICSSNSTNSENCTTQKTVTQTIPTKTLTANFTSSLGDISPYFYGIDLNVNSMAEHSWVDSDDDGTVDEPSNYIEHRNAISNLGVNFFRMNIQLIYISDVEGSFDTTSINNYGNILPKSDLIKYAYDNGYFVYINMLDMPNWLANTTTGWCNYTVSNASCPPTNYTKYGNLIVDVIDNITNNGEYASVIKYIEIGNEPYLSTWLNNLSTDNIIKATEFVKLLNNTIPIIHASYPNIKVSGGTGRSVVTYPNMFNTILSNLSNVIQFYSLHYYPYYNDLSDYENLGTTVSNITSMCSGDSCYIINSEFISASSSGDTLNLNNQIQNAFQHASYYYMWLTNMPENSSNIHFSWASQRKETSASYTWDKNYSMFSESSMENFYKSPYNVTKNFAHLCPGGDNPATVYQSSSDDSTLKTVSCKKDNQYSTIIINTDTTSKNISLDTSNIGSNYLIDSATGILYRTNAVINLGIKDSYDIAYLVTPNFTISEDDGFTKSAVSGESYSSNEVRFASSSDTSKHIASNLTAAINANVKIDLGTDCSQVSKITYTPNGGSATTFLDDSAKSVCGLLIGSGYTLTINPSLESNVLDIEYKQNTFATSVLKILIGFIALLVLLIAVAGIFIYIKSNFAELKLQDFVTYSVVLLIITILGIALMNYVADLI